MIKVELLDPVHLVAPHRVTRPEHVEGLISSIEERGWDGPPLIGYWLQRPPDDLRGGIQLLSGTHRRAAAVHLGISVPVVVYPRAVVEAVWGTDRWSELMAGELV